MANLNNYKAHGEITFIRLAEKEACEIAYRLSSKNLDPLERPDLEWQYKRALAQMNNATEEVLRLTKPVYSHVELKEFIKVNELSQTNKTIVRTIKEYQP